MKNNRYFAFLLAFLIIFTNLNIGVAFSDNELEDKLDILKEDYNNNLLLLKQQLVEQNKMDHYDIHKENLDYKYEMMKQDIVNSSYNLNSNYNSILATKTNRYYLSNGGKVTYLTNPYGFEYNYYSEEFFTRSQFLALRKSYMENLLLKDASLIEKIKDAVSNLIPMQYIGSLVFYNVVLNLKRSTISQSFIEIYNSKEKSMNISTYSGDMGASSFMSVWTTLPYAYVKIRDNAQSIKVSRY